MRWTLLLIIPLALALTSCEESESDDLAKAQKCLDEVSESNPDGALACLSSIEKYDSQQAQILKCSIYMTAGGLMENKVVRAYDLLKDSNNADKEAIYMGALALDNPDAAQGYTRAKQADVYCQKTGLTSLKYISSVIVVGSLMNSLSDTGILDPGSDPQTQIDEVLTLCSADPRPAQCDTGVIGQAVLSMSDSYCDGAGADESVCEDIEEAIAATDGSAAQVGEAIFCYLDGQTYVAGMACQ